MINELIYKGEKMAFTDNQMRELLAGIIDIQEPILPLGSVVDLKKEILQDRINLKDVDKVRIVITHRFLYGQYVKVEEINHQLQRFKNAIDTFKPYTDNFISKAAGSLDGMNSDFISKMQKTLNNMTDSTAPEMLNKAIELYSKAKAAIDSLTEVDEEISNLESYSF